MKIFLTNDDGIHAEGLWALHRALSDRHEVTVIAPDRERSAVGHGITLHKPLRTARIQANGSRPEMPGTAPRKRSKPSLRATPTPASRAGNARLSELASTQAWPSARCPMV